MGLMGGHYAKLGQIVQAKTNKMYSAICDQYGTCPPALKVEIHNHLRFLASAKEMNMPRWMNPQDCVDSMKSRIREALEGTRHINQAELDALINPHLVEFLDEVFEVFKQAGVDPPSSRKELYERLKSTLPSTR
jgi:hypothetical protein